MNHPFTGLQYASVCSGIEAVSVAWQPLGITPAWFAEIEPFPCAVLAHHYPEVPNLGDMALLTEKVLSETPSLRRTLAPIYPKLPFAKGSNRPKADYGDRPPRAVSGARNPSGYLSRARAVIRKFAGSERSPLDEPFAPISY